MKNDFFTAPFLLFSLHTGVHGHGKSENRSPGPEFMLFHGCSLPTVPSLPLFLYYTKLTWGMQSYRMIGYVLTRLTGVTFPYYVGCLFGGMLFRNIMDHYQLNLNMKEVDLIGSCSWFILPVITVVFINICNPLIITLFINLCK